MTKFTSFVPSPKTLAFWKDYGMGTSRDISTEANATQEAKDAEVQRTLQRLNEAYHDSAGMLTISTADLGVMLTYIAALEGVDPE